MISPQAIPRISVTSDISIAVTRWATTAARVTLSSLPIYTVSWVDSSTMAAGEEFLILPWGVDRLVHWSTRRGRSHLRNCNCGIHLGLTAARWRGRRSGEKNWKARGGKRRECQLPPTSRQTNCSAHLWRLGTDRWPPRRLNGRTAFSYTLFRTVRVWNLVWGRSLDSSVGIAMGYGSDSKQKARFFFFAPLQHSNWFWGSPSLLSNNYRMLFPGGKAAEAWSWLLTYIQCQGPEWSNYIFTTPYVFMALCLIN
jgi:hypothetical protein